jgi:hypothetical protein
MLLAAVEALSYAPALLATGAPDPQAQAQPPTAASSSSSSTPPSSHPYELLPVIAAELGRSEHDLRTRWLQRDLEALDSTLVHEARTLEEDAGDFDDLGACLAEQLTLLSAVRSDPALMQRVDPEYMGCIAKAAQEAVRAIAAAAAVSGVSKPALAAASDPRVLGLTSSISGSSTPRVVSFHEAVAVADEAVAARALAASQPAQDASSASSPARAAAAAAVSAQRASVQGAAELIAARAATSPSAQHQREPEQPATGTTDGIKEVLVVSHGRAARRLVVSSSPVSRPAAVSISAAPSAATVATPIRLTVSQGSVTETPANGSVWVVSN